MDVVYIIAYTHTHTLSGHRSVDVVYIIAYTHTVSGHGSVDVVYIIAYTHTQSVVMEQWMLYI